MQQRIDAIFFDWDYTLAYTRTPRNTVGERLAKMFELAGLPYSQQAIEDALERYHEAVAAGRLAALDHPQKRRDIARFYGHLLDILGEEDKSWPTMVRLYGTYAKLPTFLYADSRPVLGELSRQGFELGIITNHSRSARPVIQDLVGDLVPAHNIIISEEIGVHKPAKTIFRRAVATVRAPAPRCALIGDNLPVDAIGAVETGGFGAGVWLDRAHEGADRPLPEMVFRITTLPEAPAIIHSLNKSLAQATV